jgi:UPF0271 protein
MEIDLNADVGESFGAGQLGEDHDLNPVVSSVNIACGFHAGDPRTMEQTILATDAAAARRAMAERRAMLGAAQRQLAAVLPNQRGSTPAAR